MKETLLHTLRVGKYHATLLAKGLKASRSAPPPPVGEAPPVTLFISSLNTYYPLRLTLGSIWKHTAYPNYKIIVGENASTDGSREYLRKLQQDGKIELRERDRPQQHGEWLDEISRTVTTPFWFAVDSDMLFLSGNWLGDMMAVFLQNPNVYLVSGEPAPGSIGMIEPIGLQKVDGAERPSTWLFGVRTALREQVSDSFLFQKGDINPDTGNLQTYDTGGKIVESLRKQGLEYHIMPPAFQNQWHHFGSLSWLEHNPASGGYKRLKQYQISDIKRRVERSGF